MKFEKFERFMEKSWTAINVVYSLVGIPIMLVVVLLVYCPYAAGFLSIIVGFPTNPVIDSLPAYESKVMYTSGGFQDYTDYGKYTFGQLEDAVLGENPYLKKVTAEDLTILQAYLDDFEDWIETYDPQEEIALHYDFDWTVIDETDYFYIDDDKESKIEFASYNIYFFDTATNILYFFHNNI